MRNDHEDCVDVEEEDVEHVGDWKTVFIEWDHYGLMRGCHHTIRRVEGDSDSDGDLPDSSSNSVHNDCDTVDVGRIPPYGTSPLEA